MAPPHSTMRSRAACDRRSGGPRRRAGPVVRALPHRHLGALAGAAARNRRVPAGRQGPLAFRASPGLAARCGGSRLAAGQGLAGQPSERTATAGTRRRSRRGHRLDRRSGGAPEPRRSGERTGRRRAWPGSPAPWCAARRRGATRGRARGHQGDGVRADRPHGPGRGSHLPDRPGGRLPGDRAADDHRRRGDGRTRRDDRPERR